VLGGDVDVERLVASTDKLSGSHLMDLCRTAAELALDEESMTEEGIAVVLGRHFAAAVNEVKNKDYSNYLEQQGRAEKSMGFASPCRPNGLECY
jgi:SpoVK/Ycf46/Vps4 family AAA+-type ATPase